MPVSVSQREIDAKQIKDAYSEVEDALRTVGRLLRTTEAGRFMWATDHRTAVTGLRIVVEKLKYDVPDYGQGRGHK